MKTLLDEHRKLDKRIRDLNDEELKLVAMIDKINLENDMTTNELKNVNAKKEDILVQNNLMKLEINKI